MWAIALRALVLQRPWPGSQAGNTRGRNAESEENKNVRARLREEKDHSAHSW